jgi:hypothetical protein
LKNHRLTRAALLLALTLLFQSLRLLIPIPAVATTFIIGSLVNACLLLAAYFSGFGPAFAIAVLAPVVAYFQQMLFVPIFIIPVALGNIIYISLSLFLIKRKNGGVGIVVAASTKAVFMFGSCTWLAAWLILPEKVAAGLLFVMSWPQAVTGIAGGWIAYSAGKRLGAFRR